MTNFFFFRDQMEEYGPASPYTNFYDFFKYKYQINIDGTVAAYRFPYLLAGNSLVIKQDSKFYEFFYNQLKPNVHYIPVDVHLDHLLQLIKQLNEQQNTQHEEVVKNARLFTLQNLLPEHIFCYHINLFDAYAKLLKNKVQLKDGMQKITKDEYKCSCDKKQIKEPNDEL